MQMTWGIVLLVTITLQNKHQHSKSLPRVILPTTSKKQTNKKQKRSTDINTYAPQKDAYEDAQIFIWHIFLFDTPQNIKKIKAKWVSRITIKASLTTLIFGVQLLLLCACVDCFSLLHTLPCLLPKLFPATTTTKKQKQKKLRN